MNSDKLKIGVIGAGVFGNYHAAKCAVHKRHDFIGVYDTHSERVGTLVEKHGGVAFDNCNTLLANVEAVIVASPAIHHGPIAVAALRSGCHVLVEKPVASNLETAQTMIDLAQENNLVLQVGHQERFVAHAIGLDRVGERPNSIHSIRFSPKTERGTDVSVTLDLMTHDLDMAMWLMEERPCRVRGESLPVYSSTRDVARADLVFPGGGTAHLEASRAEKTRKRITRLDYPSGHLIIDFVNKTFENTTGFALNENFADDMIASDSLGAATNAFTESILDGKPIAVPGIAGLNALDIALQIDG